tara:strand:- start:909 stop:1349 length:441 start_codon:yes stop_codon:yes gene_type:complete
MKYYAGIGSRKTPSYILERMTREAERYEQLHYYLRSGGAVGADQAFEAGAGVHKHIILANHATPEAISLAEQFHPAWDRCTSYAKMLHGRNMMILLGYDLNTPVEFVMCWTDQGKVTGGTGQAIRAAEHYNIPVYNLYNIGQDDTI